MPMFPKKYGPKLESAPGTSRPEMDRIVSRTSNEIRAVEGIHNVGAHIGRAVFGDQVVGINSAELWVASAPQADYDATAAAIQGTVDGYSGILPTVQTYTQQILNPPQRVDAKDDVTLRVYGEDMKALRTEAEKLMSFLGDISGVVDIHITTPVEEPAIEIEVDLAAAQTYGIKPGDVRREAATLLSGIMVGNLFEDPALRQSLAEFIYGGGGLLGVHGTTVAFTRWTEGASGDCGGVSIALSEY